MASNICSLVVIGVAVDVAGAAVVSVGDEDDEKRHETDDADGRGFVR